MHVSFLILLASLWQCVVANSNACQSSTTISSQSDADSLSQCDSLEGSITISSSASGSIVLNNINEIKGSFTAQGASGVTAISAPDVTSIKSALTVDNMSSLTKLSMVALSKVESGISITNNQKLKTLDLQALEEVDGELKLTGSFTSISLSSLDQVDGAATIRGKKPLSCSSFDSLRSNDVFEGSYSCSMEGGSSLSAGAKAGIAIGVIIIVFLFVLGGWWILRKRRQRQAYRRRAVKTNPSSPLAPRGDEKPPQSEYKPVPVQEQELLVPRKPIGPAAALVSSPAILDGQSIHEAAFPASPIPVYHELDAGPVRGWHQRPIHPET